MSKWMSRRRKLSRAPSRSGRTRGNPKCDGAGLRAGGSEGGQPLSPATLAPAKPQAGGPGCRKLHSGRVGTIKAKVALEIFSGGAFDVQIGANRMTSFDSNA